MVLFIIASYLSSHHHSLHTDVLLSRSTLTPASPLCGGPGAGGTSPPPSGTWSPPSASATGASTPARWTLGLCWSRMLASYLLLAEYANNASYWLMTAVSQCPRVRLTITWDTWHVPSSMLACYTGPGSPCGDFRLVVKVWLFIFIHQLWTEFRKES